MHLCTLVSIYSYISLSIHIPLYHLCIISFMRFYHNLAIHVIYIFLSCMLLLIHVFLSCSIYSFMYEKSYIHIIYSYIHIMSSTCNILYLVNLYLHVLYQTVLSPVGVQNRDSSFDTRRYFSYLCSFTYQIYIYCYFLFISTSFLTMYSN